MRRIWLLWIAVALVCTSANALGTKKKWDGVQREPGFGCVSGTTTFGQVITVPHSKHTLNKFSFWWVRSTKGSMVVRGEVYAWDGSKAMGNSLYESSPRTIKFTDDSFHKESFAPAGLAVTPGAQYVLFASTDKDFSQCSQGDVLAWGAVDDSAYAGGTFVFLNSGGDSGKWTTESWHTAGLDTAFMASLKR